MQLLVSLTAVTSQDGIVAPTWQKILVLVIPAVALLCGALAGYRSFTMTFKPVRLLAVLVPLTLAAVACVGGIVFEEAVRTDRF